MNHHDQASKSQESGDKDTNPTTPQQTPDGCIQTPGGSVDHQSKDVIDERRNKQDIRESLNGNFRRQDHDQATETGRQEYQQGSSAAVNQHGVQSGPRMSYSLERYQADDVTEDPWTSLSKPDPPSA